MSAVSICAGIEQVLGGALAPLVPGAIQHWKARLQGRRGPSPVQPLRELRRLWSKTTVTVEGTTLVYRLAPCVAVAAMAAAILFVPVAVGPPDWGIGHDALVLAGLFALARFAVAASAWDTGNGFALMGASRDLMISVFAEATLGLAMVVAALIARSTDLTTMIAATSGSRPWSTPVLALGAAAFALVVIAETGRQPVDNPDTHLELTMIHEGPLLEYAGRDLAYLQWVMAARHWVLLVLAALVFLPHPASPWGQLAVLPCTMIALCALLAVTETMVAKMRVLAVPRLLATGALVALLGIAVGLTGLA